MPAKVMRLKDFKQKQCVQCDEFNAQNYLFILKIRGRIILPMDVFFIFKFVRQRGGL